CEGLRIVGQRLDQAGRPTDLARILVPAAALPSAEFDFAATPDGGLVGSWAQRIVGPQGADRALVIRRFRPNGEPRGAAFRASPESVHSRPSSPPFEPTILAPTARRIQLAWRRIADGRVITRTFDTD